MRKSKNYSDSNHTQAKEDHHEEHDNYLNLQSEMEKCREDLLRKHADNENLRKRCKREIEDAHKYAMQDFITRMLPVMDSMEQGLDIGYMEDGIDAESLIEGMNSTMKIMMEAFKSVGLEVISPQGGAPFDPEVHEAMKLKHTDDVEPNKIMAVFQKGYLLNGRLIRPARVEVSA